MQFGDRHEVAGRHLGRWDLLAAAQREQVVEALAFAGATVDELVVDPQLASQHSEQVDAADVLIGEGLDDIHRCRSVVGERVRSLRRGGALLDQEVEQQFNPQAGRG